MAADVHGEEVKTDYLLTYPGIRTWAVLASSNGSRMDRCPVHTESVFWNFPSGYSERSPGVRNPSFKSYLLAA